MAATVQPNNKSLGIGSEIGDVKVGLSPDEITAKLKLAVQAEQANDMAQIASIADELRNAGVIVTKDDTGYQWSYAALPTAAPVIPIESGKSRSKSQLKREAAMKGESIETRLPVVGDRVYYKSIEYAPSEEATITAVHGLLMVNLKTDSGEHVTSVVKHNDIGDPEPRTWRFMH